MTDTITKRDIVIKVQKDLGPRMTQLEVKEVVQRVLDMVVDSLAAGHTVELRNFGIFKPVKRKARIGRNPNNPSVEVRIPEKWVADFKPGRIMKMRVSELEGTPGV
jgi:nucleoid DNA-binding protein